MMDKEIELERKKYADQDNQNIRLDALLAKIPLRGKKDGHTHIKAMLKVLDRRYKLFDYLNKTKIIHVTGTNGKGSVCRMLNAIYVEAGYSVGLFTSPHMDYINERIVIDDKAIDVTSMEAAYVEIQSIVEEIKKERDNNNFEPSFFEWVFSMALLSFLKKDLEVCIIEVGIGGTSDTTNIIKDTNLSVITSIGLDHMHIIGDSVEAIAKEKSGILRESGKAVVMANNPRATRIILEKGRQLNVDMLQVFGDSYKIDSVKDKKIDFSLYTTYYNYIGLCIKSSALYQVENASIAIACLWQLKDTLPVTEANIREGLDRFRIVGRFEWLYSNVLIDGAHNPIGIRAMMESVRWVTGFKKNSILIGLKSGKDAHTILDLLNETKLFTSYYLADISIQNRISKEHIFSYLHTKTKEVYLIDDLQSFIEDFRRDKPDELLVISGSLYLVSDIRKLVKEATNDSI